MQTPRQMFSFVPDYIQPVLAEQRLNDHEPSAAWSERSSDRGDDMDEWDRHVADLDIVAISASAARLGNPWDLCDKLGIRHRLAR